MSKKDKNEMDKTPKWLKAIQFNSWEAELLISALLLYSLFQIPDLIEAFHLKNFGRDSQFHLYFKIIRRAIELLKFGYILHIIARGLWVASIGLSYVFPKGIEAKKLNFKGGFDKELDSKNSLVNNVLRLEELSSLFYGISFMAFGIILGVGTFLFIFVLISEGMTEAIVSNSRYMVWYVTAFFVFIMFLLLLFIDFITNGLFRRIDWMAAWFYPVAIFFRILTFSFLYRRSLLVLISNTKGWKSYLIPIAVLLVCGGFIIIRSEIRDGKTANYMNRIQTASFMNENYENLRLKDDELFVTIQSDLVESSALRIFMDDLGLFNRLYRRDTTARDRNWARLSSDSTSIFLNKWLTVQVDSIEFENIRWGKAQHSTELNFGFIGFLDIEAVDRGSHNLIIKIDTTQLTSSAKRMVKDGIYEQLFISNINFFYDK